MVLFADRNVLHASHVLNSGVIPITLEEGVTHMCPYLGLEPCALTFAFGQFGHGDFTGRRRLPRS